MMPVMIEGWWMQPHKEESEVVLGEEKGFEEVKAKVLLVEEEEKMRVDG